MYRAVRHHDIQMLPLSRSPEVTGCRASWLVAAMLLRRFVMMRIAWILGGLTSLLLGAIGALRPLLPTVPFLILSAFCLARGHPRLEAWLVEHPRFGPPIRAWRHHRAISVPAKRAALLAFTVSAGLGAVLLAWPWILVPPAVAIIGGAWILSRPSR